MKDPSSETYEKLINENIMEMKKALEEWKTNIKTIEEQIALDSMF